MILQVKKLNELAKIPTYGTECAAGADLYAAISEAITLQPGETKLIPTGLSMAIPTGLVTSEEQDAIICQRHLAGLWRLATTDKCHLRC